MSKIELNIQKWPIDRLIPYEKNVKKHDKAQVQKIAESIKRFGWTSVISVDKDGVIIGGHGRRLAAISLGLTEVPVWVRDNLTPAEVKAARLADNRVAESAIDTLMLQEELASLELSMQGIFDDKELAFMEADLTEINEDALAFDIMSSVSEQEHATAADIEATDEKEIAIDKVFGFKKIAARHQRVLTRFMAQIESDSGLPPAEAFIQFISGILAA